MTNSFVSDSLDGGIAVIQMDDGKANALGPQMISELGAAFARAESEASAIVLMGRPGRFCAGFDLKIMGSGADAARKLVRLGADLMLRIYACPRPVVTACTGHAMAAGALLILVGDVRIGVEGPFQIGLNEVRIGLPMPLFGQQLVRDRLDPRHVERAVLRAETFDPATAQSVGYFDTLATPEDFVATTMAEARRLTTLSASAYAATKADLRADSLRFVRETLADNIANLAVPTGLSR